MRREEDDLQPSDGLTKETLERAEEIYQRLTSKLSIDRRGEAAFYNGAYTDLGSQSKREFSITVADIGGQPWLTLISDAELPRTDNGLLVYKVSPSDGRRYVGSTQSSRPGRRESDHPSRYFTIYDIVRDARR